MTATHQPGTTSDRPLQGTYVPPPTKDRTGVGILVWLFLIWAVIMGATKACQVLDLAGYVSHDADVPVYISGNWMNGEYRTCYAGVDQKTGKMNVLDCAGGTTEASHELPVTFHGEYPTTNRDIKAGQKAWVWRCQRVTSSLTCKIAD